MEKSIALTLGVLGGERSFYAAGTLSQSDAISPVQLLLDIELRDYLQRLIKPVDLTDEAFAEEIITEIAPSGARYLEAEHTYEHFRNELWFPMFFDRRGVKPWLSDQKSVMDEVRRKAADLLANAPNQSPLDEKQRGEILRICNAADKELG